MTALTRRARPLLAGLLMLPALAAGQQASSPENPGLAESFGNPDNYTSTTHGDWERVCEKTGGACIMAQVGKDSLGTPVMEMRIRKLPEPREVEGKKIVAVVDLLTPLGVLLLPGIELRIDDGPVYTANYHLCSEVGCLSREPLAEDTANAFKAGGKATVSLVAAAKGEVIATISLKGFTAAYDAL
ncbi:invasion associated locus B family protein [Granulosicoccaceae sp. 1_MG-2023]|nr:invasion associated locus B family protein [Granulosicoccaceae sp. 1_MG-2023]